MFDIDRIKGGPEEGGVTLCRPPTLGRTLPSSSSSECVFSWEPIALALCEAFLHANIKRRVLKIFSVMDIYFHRLFCYQKSMPTWSAAEAGNIHHPNLLMSIYFYKGDVSLRRLLEQNEGKRNKKKKKSTSALLANLRSLGYRQVPRRKDAAVRAHALGNVARIAHAPLGITHVDDIESAYWNLVTPRSFKVFSLDAFSVGGLDFVSVLIFFFLFLKPTQNVSVFQRRQSTRLNEVNYTQSKQYPGVKEYKTWSGGKRQNKQHLMYQEVFRFPLKELRVQDRKKKSGPSRWQVATRPP